LENHLANYESMTLFAVDGSDVVESTKSESLGSESESTGCESQFESTDLN